MAFFNQYPYINVNDLNLDWIIAHFKEFIDEIASLETWRSEHEQEYNELKNLYDNFMLGKFTPEFTNALNNWLMVNAPTILHDVIAIINVKVSDSGYMYITSPDAWKDVKFLFSGINIFPPEVSEYGHIIIAY